MKNTQGIFLVILSIAMFFLFGKPWWDEVTILQDEKGEHLKVVDDLQSIEDTKNTLLAKLNEIPPEERQKIDTFLPSESEIVHVVASIDGVASRHGISVTEAATGVNQPDLSRLGSESAFDPGYDSKIISIAFTAKYAEAVSFLKDIEKSLRIVDIVSVDGAPVAQSSGAYQYKVGMKVYSLKDIEL